MGVIRCFLAIAVITAHCGPAGLGVLAGGRFAVQSFFILSGFYMSLVLTVKYPVNKSGRYEFWKARAWRLLPIYIIGLMLSAICLMLPLEIFGSPIFTSARFLESLAAAPGYLKVWIISANGLIIGTDSLLFLAPLDFGMSLATDDLHYALLIPQSWSLSLEVLFYCAAPWICRLKTSRVIFILSASLAFRVLLLTTTACEGDPWTYRFLPFEIALFSMGILSYRLSKVARFKLFYSGSPVLASVPFMVFFCLPHIQVNEAVYWISYALFALSLPSLFSFSSTSFWDKAIGELAYPAYILHHIPLGFLFAAFSKTSIAPLLPLITCTLVFVISGIIIRVDKQIQQSFRGRTILTTKHSPVKAVP